MLCERSRNLIEGKLVTAGHVDPWANLPLRSWLSAGETVLMEVVGENARAMLVAIQDLESENAIDVAIGMFDSAVSKDSRAHKSKVETPVIPGALSDAAQQERAALLADEEVVDRFLWAVQRHATKHGHDREGVEPDDCALCWAEAVGEPAG